MKWFLGFPRPGLVGLAVLLCALIAPASASAAAAISVSSGSLAFGNQDILAAPGVSQYKTVIVSSTGNVGLTLGDPTITGSAAFYEVQDNCSGQTLVPSTFCTITLAFDPATIGAVAATFSVPSNAGPAVTINMSGTGVATGVFSPSSPGHNYNVLDVFAGTPVNNWFRITNAGSAALNISTVSVTGTGAANFIVAEQNCAGASIATGAFCDVRVYFDPLSAGLKQATLHFVHNAAGGQSDITLSGTGIHAKFSPSSSSLAFGSQSVVAGAATQSVTVTNTGDHPLSISFFEILGPDADHFAVDATVANTCDDGNVAIGASCTLPVKFDPSGPGARSATLNVWHNDPSSTPTSGQSAIALGGTGSQSQATAAPSLLQFAARDIFVGPSAAGTVTITNTGNESLLVNSAAITGAAAAEYAITGGTCTLSPPKTLAIGEACTYTVNFDPADDAEGRLAALEVTHTGINSPTTVELAGLGLRPQLSISAGEMRFEQHFTGSGASAPQWTRFENFGSGPLTLGEQSIVGAGAADYSIYFNDCANRTLVPSEFCDVAISFDPKSAGAKNAVLRMTHSPLPMTVSDVPLAGIATAQPQLKFSVTSPKRLRLRTTKTITYSVKCPITCTVTANANLLLPGKGKKRKRSTLGWKQVTVQAGKTGKLTFKLTGLQRYALTYAARDHKKISVSATFSAWADGYSEAASTRGFKLK